ncbi:hypothetical protein CY35_12G103700 [Sphagnum magellanicum]|nr:hypothetical protein CY35_12G103700 [Sphagnum magellanicum]
MVVEMATTMRVMSSHVAVQRRFNLLISSRNFLSRNIDTLPIQGRNLRFVISYGVTKHHLMYTKSEHMMRFSSRRTVARAMSTPAVVDSEPASTVNKDTEVSTSDTELLCCPICFEPLIRKGPAGLNQAAVARSAFFCARCRKGYSTRDVYLDLTLLATAKEYQEIQRPRTELFRSPLVAFVYERGWRQNFNIYGFPGPDEEVKMAQDFLKPTVGGVLLDVSCGSGLFTRRFAQSGDFKAVIALDFSENMLRQTYEFIKQDRLLTAVDIALVRADVGRLPFATGSIDAVHAGAALHCWTSPAAGVSEISRILKPGGVFVATTYVLSPLLDFGNKELHKILKQAAISTLGPGYWNDAELEELFQICGLVDIKSIRHRNFIMLSACKPEQA